MKFQPDENLLAEHRRWLAAFETQYALNWEKLLTADAEAAACEAAVRRLLQVNGNAVFPNESLTGSDQAPDFRCEQGGSTFFVEATSVGIDKATRKTGLSHLPTNRAGNYRSLNDAFFDAARQKTRQCANLLHLALVAVGTFHYRASVLGMQRKHLEMLLTGETALAFLIDTRTGSAVGDPYQTTALRSAAFVRPDPETGLGHARSSLAGLLLCGFGCEPTEVRGVLHPSSARRFDRSLLPGVEFCRLREGYEAGKFATEWI